MKTYKTFNNTQCALIHDEVISSQEYASKALVTLIGVILYEMGGGIYFYLAAMRQDSAESINKILLNKSNFTGFNNWYSYQAESKANSLIY